jgi:hypothetical protein
MYISTHNDLSKLNFDDLFNHCIDNSKSRNTDNVLFLLSLSTGINLKLFLKWKWKDLLNWGSDNDAIVIDEIKFRKYYIPIHPLVQKKISDIYVSLGYPELNSYIFFFYDYIVDEARINRGANKIVREIVYECCNLEYSYIKNNEHLITTIYDFEFLSQIMFGKKVFETCGYTNETCKKLKQHFQFRKNNDLFSFLKYTTKNDIQFKLSNIDLIEGIQIVNLDKKNFNDGKSPFQKFSSFEKYLTSVKLNDSKELQIPSIILLLLISMNSGIRLSKLLNLTWEGIIKHDDFYKDIYVSNSIKFNGYTINFNENLKTILEYHFRNISKIKNGIQSDGKEKFDSLSNLQGKIFLMNNGNPITQPSLSREIKNVLHRIKFPYWDKVTTKTPLIMFGRRILEIKGDHKSTIAALVDFFNFRSKRQLFKFLYIDYNPKKDIYEFKGKSRNNIFDEIFYNK